HRWATDGSRLPLWRTDCRARPVHPLAIAEVLLFVEPPLGAPEVDAVGAAAAGVLDALAELGGREVRRGVRRRDEAEVVVGPRLGLHLREPELLALVVGRARLRRVVRADGADLLDGDDEVVAEELVVAERVHA